jgi:hypothetical protein
VSAEDPDLQRDDELFQHLLAAPRVQQPSAEQLERWTQHFSAELRAVRRRRYVRRIAATAVAGAAVVALTITLTTTQPPPANGTAVAHVATAFGGNVIREDGEVRRVLQPGAAVRAGELVESGQRSGLGLTYRSADVRLDAETSVVFHEDRLELRQGSVYVDVVELDRPPGTGNVQVDTPLGTFTHLGTQFMVTVAAAEVSGAVREGVIALRSGQREVRLTAAPNRARMVVADASGDLRQLDVPASGALWAWALQSSPRIVVAGRSPEDVLQWVARERGQRLDYADGAAKQLARESRLGGADIEMSLEDAVDTVDRTTRLHVDESAGDELLVSMDSEADQNAQ